MRVLRATGIETEAELAYGGLHALLRPLAGRLDAKPGRYAALQAASGLADREVAPGRLAAAAATHAVLVTVAEQQPLLLLVDDVQWLDRPTLDALTFAIRRLERRRSCQRRTGCGRTLRRGRRSCSNRR